MGHTLSVRLDADLAAWLEETARSRGVSKGRIVKEQLQQGRKKNAEPTFMRLAGSIAGPRNLSSRKGFQRR